MLSARVALKRRGFNVATAKRRTQSTGEAAGGWAGTEIGVIMSKTWLGRLGHREQADRRSGGGPGVASCLVGPCPLWCHVKPGMNKYHSGGN